MEEPVETNINITLLLIPASVLCRDLATVNGSMYYTQTNARTPGLVTCVKDIVITEPGLIFNTMFGPRRFNFVSFVKIYSNLDKYAPQNYEH